MGTLNQGVQFALYFVVGLTLLFQHASALCVGEDSCCDGIKCRLGEGDCDTDTSCEGKLKCGTDNCIGESFDKTDDCCYDPFPPTTRKPSLVTSIMGPGIDCKAMIDSQLIIRNTRIASGCDIGNPTISLNTCSQISCLEDIAKKSGTCARQSEKIDCQSLEKVSTAISTVTEHYCDKGGRTPAQTQSSPGRPQDVPEPRTGEEPPPVDASWGDWGSWSCCSITSGEGSRSRNRTCNVAENGGSTSVCTSPGTETESCNTDQCPPGHGTSLDWDFCSSSFPCTHLQGDCDNDSECVQDHVCGNNNCVDFWNDAESDADCCIPAL